MNTTESTQRTVMVGGPHWQAEEAVLQNPEVQGMIKRLANFGLGVCWPHMHVNGKMVPLKSGIVSYENEKQEVAFLPSDDERVTSSAPVGWRWDSGLDAIAACHSCDHDRT